MSQTMTGGRAQLYLPDESGILQLAGVYESVNYTKGLGVEDIHTLGAYGPREIAITSYNAVTLSCSGFRVIGKGTTVLGKFPKLGDLLKYQGVTIQVRDRQDNGKIILVAVGCVPTSENGNHNARATSRMTINYTGIAIFDEATLKDGNPEDGEGVGWP